MMIGVAPATHDLVLWGLIAVGVLIAVAILHNHWMHRKTRQTLGEKK